MIIQSTSNLSQANQPDIRVNSAALVRTITDTPSPNAVTPVSVAEVNGAVTAINQVMQHANLDVAFSVDTDSHRTVIRMTDTSTGELIRQFPSESVLAIAHGIDQFQQGLLLKQKA
ncbi:MAG: flagellar protein FlaG [Thiobacillaceae bacterium]